MDHGPNIKNVNCKARYIFSLLKNMLITMMLMMKMISLQVLNLEYKNRIVSSAQKQKFHSSAGKINT